MQTLETSDESEVALVEEIKDLVNLNFNLLDKFNCIRVSEAVRYSLNEDKELLGKI